MRHLLPLFFTALTLGLSGQVNDSLRAVIEAGSGTVLDHPTYGPILRTPVERFADLPAYPFASHYVDVDPGDDQPLYMHYLDEGPADGPVVLLLHGNPAWSYVVRDLVEPLTAAGFRVVAPDLIGFGKSDKPARRSVHTYDNQVAWVTRFIEALDLREITLHCQDWGGLIGLRVAVYETERFARVAASNTALPDGTIGNEESFSRWRDVISQQVEQFSTVMDRATVSELTADDLLAYDAPYPEDRYTAGPRQLPSEVPFDPDSPEARENTAALELWAEWTKPLMTLFAEPEQGGVTAGGQAQLRDLVPGAAGQPHRNFSTDIAAHYIREDIPDTIARYLIAFATPAQDTFSTDSLLAYAATFPPMPKESVDLFALTGERSVTFGSGLPYNDLEYTLYDTDYMEGETNGFDVFMPVDPSRAFPGADEIKLLRGVNNVDLNAAYDGADGDRYILGTAEIDVPFFLRGEDGVDNDYVSVTNFDYNYGYVQLRGTADDYALVYCDGSQGCATEGSYLFYTAGDQLDLVAFIWPCDDLALPISGAQPRNPRALCNATGRLRLDDTTHFRFAEPLDLTVAEPDGLAQFGGAGKELIGGITVDASGNSYVFGMTDSNLDGEASGDNEIFVQQILPDGSAGWLREIVLPDGSLLFDGVTDADYLYVAGRTLGALPGFTNAGRWDGILLKYRLRDGELVATDQYGNPGLDGYGNITLDGAGHLYVSGAGSPPGAPGTDPDYLVAKHRTDDLSNVWRYVQPPGAERVIVSEGWGGLTYVPATAGGEEARLVTGGWYMTQGGANGFLEVLEGLDAAAPRRVAYTTVASPGPQADWVLDNTADAAGNIYAVGFTTGVLGTAHLGEHDAFIVRYDRDLANPTFLQLGTAVSDAYRKVTIDSVGDLYAIGYTYGDYARPNPDRSLGSGDVIVDKFSPDLQLLASRQLGTPHEERGYHWWTPGGLYIGGLTEAALAGPSGGSFDGFVLRLSADDLATTTDGSPVSAADPVVARELAIALFPNPAGDWLQLRLEGQHSGHVELLDAGGRRLQRHSFVASSLKLDLSDQSRGTYYLRIVTAGATAFRMLVKQ